MTELTTPSAFFSQRPQLIVEGSLDEAAGEGIAGLSIRHCLGAPAALTIDLWPGAPAEPGGAHDDLAERMALGTGLAVQVGDPPTTIFSGRVTALAHRWSSQGTRIRVTAHDRLREWADGQRTRRFEESSMSDVAAGVAGARGLSVQVAAAASGLTRSWIQFNQTDLHFLAQVCAAVGADFFLEDDELFVQTPARAADSPVTLQFGRGLVTFDAETSLSEQITSVAVYGWDPGSKQVIERRAAFPDAELRQCESGPLTMDDHYAQPADVHLNHTADSHAHADALARAVYEDHAHRFVTARGTAAGEPDLLVGEWVDIGGLDSRHDGRYYLREVGHRFTAQDGFTTAFVAQRPCSDQSEDRHHDDNDRPDQCDGDSGGKSGRGRRFDPFSRLGKLVRQRRRRPA